MARKDIGMKIFLDFETRSTADIRRVGAWVYASHPSTEILCMGFAIGDGPVEQLSRFSGPVPFWVLDSASRICAHNSHFEYAVWHYILHQRHGWPAIDDPARWTCTMARAAVVGLPLALDDLTRVLPCRTTKDLEGRRIMLQLAKPKAVDALGDSLWDESPGKMRRLMDYNRTDVLAEREVDGLLPELSAEERKVWELDLLINRRGVQVDVQFASRAATIAEELTVGLNERLKELTGGEVDKATRVLALRQYFFSKHDIVSETLDKAALNRLLADPSIPQGAKAVLDIRRQVGKSSTAKYQKAVDAASPADDRVRGTIQYHAAHTGRWGGRLIQPQNYVQGLSEEDQAAVVDATRKGSDYFSLAYDGEAMSALSGALRGMITASSGKTLVCADYNAIEARILFWFAVEHEALSAYRRGESPYLSMGERIYGRKIGKKEDPQEYDIAKRTVLGCGYGMGAKKFRENILAETGKKGTALDIGEELAQCAVRSYREKYPSVVQIWHEIERQAINAVREPGKVFPCCGGRVKWALGTGRWTDYLVCRLPSGHRYLWYYRPRIMPGITPWGKEKAELTYVGEHPGTREWARLKVYGGLLTENVVQAVARDILANGMLRVEAAGFPIVLTVHDEIVTEVDERKADLKKVISEMCTPPSWAFGLPLAAEGWVGARYRK